MKPTSHASEKGSPRGKGAVVDKATAEAQQYLTFSLDGEIFALGILHIIEIIEYRELTVVPLMPQFIRGVINLRGAVLPVVDLRARFGRVAASVSRKTCVVIVELQSDEGRQDIGIMVDQVNEVVEIPAKDVEPAPAFGSRLRADFISAMGRIGGRFIVVLNLDNLLCIEELARAAAAATATTGDAGELAAEPPAAG